MSFHAFAIGKIVGPGFEARCVFGKGGVLAAEAKREGDGATPAGLWLLKRVLYRPDREPRPETGLPCAPLSPDDGWCDAPSDAAYNAMVKHPCSASAEKLWREDHVYDLILVLGYNDAPVIAGMGSAIFWHLAQPDWRPTEGCVATTRETLLAALAVAKPGDALSIMD